MIETAEPPGPLGMNVEVSGSDVGMGREPTRSSRSTSSATRPLPPALFERGNKPRTRAVPDEDPSPRDSARRVEVDCQFEGEAIGPADGDVIDRAVRATAAS